MKMHADHDWINKKIGGHGGSYSCNSANGLAIIGYIYDKSDIQIFWYNVILLFKYFKRKVKKMVRLA